MYNGFVDCSINFILFPNSINSSGNHHSSLGGFTPYQVFSGDYVGLAKTKQSALNSMYERHPERFSNGRPKVQMPATEVLINPVPADADQVTIEKGVNFPTLQRVIEKIT